MSREKGLFEPDMSVKLATLQLKNPIITASGTCGFGQEMEDYLDVNSLGALTVKGLTLEASAGNPTPRIAETASGLLNAIGLENPGVEGFLQNKLEIIAKYDIPVFVNISGHAVDDFAIMAERFSSYSEIDALEINVSCPNIAGGGMVFGTNGELLYKVTKKVRENYDGPLIIKLSPNVTDIVEMAQAAETGGADILSLINTLLGMAIDVKKQGPVLANTFGGLSGPAIKPIALRMVYEVAEKIDLPLIGMGGIMTGEDALEFILAGASAVGIGTATLVEPSACERILREIKMYMVDNDIQTLNELRGKAISYSI